MSETSVTHTHLLGGRIALTQPARGYRVGMDGALLAAAVASVAMDKKAARALELGCGVGGALLSLKARAPELAVTGIEREADYAALARRNAGDTGFAAEIIDGDIGAGFKSFGLERFDLVFSNPPYFDDPNQLRAPDAAKRPAWIADHGLGVWLDFAQSAVKDGGHVVFIHRADRMGDILGGLSRCGSFVIRPIHPFADQDAKRVIVRAQRLGKAPLRLLPPLILHDGGERKHTETVEAILRGEAALEW
jgi:tRNA1(Val) A37 N6-methylase TrmN6